MVIDQINIGRVTPVKSINDPQILRDLDCELTVILALEGMEIESWKVHIRGIMGLVKRIHDSDYSIYLVLIERTGFSSFPEEAKTLVLNLEDHLDPYSIINTKCNSQRCMFHYYFGTSHGYLIPIDVTSR